VFLKDFERKDKTKYSRKERSEPWLKSWFSREKELETSEEKLEKRAVILYIRFRFTSVWF